MDSLRALARGLDEGLIRRAAMLAGEGEAMGPFEIHGRRGEEHLAGKLAGRTDAALGDGLLGGFAGELEGDGGRIVGIGREKIDGAADSGPEPLDGKAGQAVNAGFARGEPPPVLLLADAQRRHHAHARHGDRLVQCLAHSILSIRAEPSPR